MKLIWSFVKDHKK